MFEHGPALRELLTTNLAAHPVLAIPVDDRRRAAVAIVVVDSEINESDAVVTAGSDMRDVPGDLAGFDGRVQGVGGGAAFLLCVRAAKMNRHAGQWALPGGRIDEDESVEDAANPRPQSQESRKRLNANS